MPLDTVNRIWYKDIEGIGNMQVLIPPPNKVIFHKANGERGAGGRDKCAFFVFGLREFIPNDWMLIEGGTGKIIPYPESSEADDNPETAVPIRHRFINGYSEEKAISMSNEEREELNDKLLGDLKLLKARTPDGGHDVKFLKTRSGGAYERFKTAVRSVANTIPDFVAEQKESIATENTKKAIRSKRSITIISESEDNVKSIRKVADDSQSFGFAFELANDEKAHKDFENDSQQT